MSIDDQHWDVGGMGAICVDVAVTVPHMPLEDGKVQYQGRELRVGGPVPTALAMLSRFGRKTTFIGEWTNDIFGNLIDEDLQREQIDAGLAVRTKNKQTAVSLVLIQQASATRAIIYERLKPLTLSVQTAQALARCTTLHLDGTSADAAIAAAKIVKGNGGAVFFDIDAPNPGINELFPYSDVAICPERSLAHWGWRSPEEGGKELLNMGVQTAIVTQGKNGSIAFTKGEQLAQPAFRIAAADTTGAGDVFCGALIEGHLENMAFPESLRFAAATAALKCTKMGNRDALPTKDMVMDFLSKQ